MGGSGFGVAGEQRYDATGFVRGEDFWLVEELNGAKGWGVLASGDFPEAGTACAAFAWDIAGVLGLGESEKTIAVVGGDLW